VREVVPAALDGERVDRVVAMLTALPRAEVARLVDRGAVRIGGAPVAARSRRVAEGDVLEVDVPAARAPDELEGDQSVPFTVVHADDDVVVVDKPAGVVVHPGAGVREGTLVQGLLARFPDVAAAGGDPDRPGIVHRLDKGTSGLLAVARTDDARRSLVAQLAARAVDRRYLALVWGEVEASQGMIDAPVGRSRADRTRMAVSAVGREARTRYAVRQRFPAAGVTLLECSLDTGRTHQVRVHLAAIGHPVVGDARYGGARSGMRCPRPFLHACSLAFDHPRSGERLRFDSALPADLRGVLVGVE